MGVKIEKDLMDLHLRMEVEFKSYSYYDLVNIDENSLICMILRGAGKSREGKNTVSESITLNIIIKYIHHHF
jgi:hypothetical protein